MDYELWIMDWGEFGVANGVLRIHPQTAGTADFWAIMDYELWIMDWGKLGVINVMAGIVAYA